MKREKKLGALYVGIEGSDDGDIVRLLNGSGCFDSLTGARKFRNDVRAARERAGFPADVVKVYRLVEVK